MPNKAVASWIQVPVVAGDVLSVMHRRANGSLDVEVVYQIRDDASAVRGTRRLSTTTASYPMSGAAVIAACNAQEGT